MRCRRNMWKIVKNIRKKGFKTHNINIISIEFASNWHEISTMSLSTPTQLRPKSYYSRSWYGDGTVMVGRWHEVREKWMGRGRFLQIFINFCQNIIPKGYRKVEKNAFFFEIRILGVSFLHFLTVVWNVKKCLRMEKISFLCTQFYQLKLKVKCQKLQLE